MNLKHYSISKVLIANRGEIARRIQRACKKLGLPSVSVASEADATSLFAREADELVIIGPPAPNASYLMIDKLLEVAKATNCDAVHPGYGFLSENPEFARRVEESGLVFIGPSHQSITLLGSKTRAKELAKSAKVPFAASSPGNLNDQQLLLAAESIGYPILVKAVAGGGGRGMRTAQDAGELEAALPRARAEALKFFSNQDIYLERLIERPRHVEVQVFGDRHGNLIHLGTRDCSTQRRHQKLIEEAPAPGLSPKLREKLHRSALAVVKAANYHNAGTVEFLVKGEEFFFLEVNTRIQVEHPVTELVTGIDLVELQIRVARGEKLPFKQREIVFNGHAIEYRICAEIPGENFRPATGRIERILRSQVSGPSFGVREDFGFEQGDSISPYYDSLLSKVIIHGGSRGQAIDKSLEFLRSYAVEGVSTNVAFHLWALYNSKFRSSPLDIGYVEREFSVKSLLEVELAALRDPHWRSSITGSSSNEDLERGNRASPRRQSKAKVVGADQNGGRVTDEALETRGFEGAIVENVYRYQSKKFNTTYTIEVLHKRDGFFVAVPVDQAGRRAKSTSCRMSNGLNTVVDSIINDVLEKTPPTEIFTN